MSKTKNSEAGFSALEIILVVVLIAAIGVVGYQAWQNSRKTTTSQSTQSTSKSASPTPTPSVSPAQKYFTIKEWGVKAPYDGTDTLTYTINSSNVATIISRELATKNAGCATYGAGLIRKLAPSDGTNGDGTGPTAEQYSKQNPGTLGHVNGYYYMFTHDQAVCSTDGSIDRQNQANDTTKSLVMHFQASN